MITLKINDLEIQVQERTTLLEAARMMGIPIPTLCHMEGLSPYGACRLCVVEIGEAEKAKLVSSCTYPAQDGLTARTASARVLRARNMVLELLLASCPQSKTIQDLAAAHNVRRPSRIWPPRIMFANSVSGKSTRIASSAGCACGCAKSR
jgi:predicted molibdopterin-dependent oxidoreductase YjgC